VEVRKKESLFLRLEKTRDFLTRSIQSAISGSGEIDIGMLEDIEDQLILADLGIEVSREIVGRLRNNIRLQRITTAAEVRQELRADIVRILQPVARPWSMPAGSGTRIVLVVGVNGVGKTTTVAKLAKWLGRQGNSVMLAACDTFRAAAIDQLQVWGHRLDIPVVAQERGTDAAAVAHDAFASARAKGIDTLIIDSAGRQHVNADLMEQLRKIHRVLGRIDESAPQETLLVVDAGNGQNVIAQTEAFHAAVVLTGICVTKLDGTARGGIIVALARSFGIPIPFIAMGENLEDLALFDAGEFANALLPESE
jgi:fused signal recognition particle receptor